MLICVLLFDWNDNTIAVKIGLIVITAQQFIKLGWTHSSILYFVTWINVSFSDRIPRTFIFWCAHKLFFKVFCCKYGVWTPCTALILETGEGSDSPHTYKHPSANQRKRQRGRRRASGGAEDTAERVKRGNSSSSYLRWTERKNYTQTHGPATSYKALQPAEADNQPDTSYLQLQTKKIPL